MAIITTREIGATAKGTPLTNAEIDNNFINLNADIATRIPSTEKGAANGVATLDVNGLVPTTQLPSYVDDVIEATNLASFPATGEAGKIYVARDTNKTYRWSGSTYVFITSGAVDSVAGKTGVVTLASSDVGLGNVENKSSATIRGELTSGNVTGALGFTPYNATNPAGYTTNVGTVTSVAATAGTGISITGSPITASGTLTITNTAPDQTVALTGAGATSITGTYPNFTITSVNTTYSAATSTVLGLVELASDTVQTVAANAVTATASRTYGIQVNSSGQMVVNVPWVDTDTNTITRLRGTATGTFQSGDLTLVAGTNVTITQSGTDYTIAAAGYTLPTATASVTGGVRLGSDTAQTVAANAVTATASRSYAVQLNASGQMVVNVPWVDTDTDTNTITRLRGTASGTFQSGDLTLLAGTNVTITQSGSDYTIAASQPAVGDGTLSIAAKAAGLTNTDVTLELSGAYSANTTTNRTIRAIVGPALTNLTALMATAGAGFIRRGATADTYTIDTNTYLTSFTEVDTLATVTGRGATTTTLIQLSNQAAINTTTPGLVNYGLHFTGQTTPDLATGITWNGGTGTLGAQAGIYVQGSGNYGTRMFIATTDSYAVGAKTAVSISEFGVVNFLRARPQWNGVNLVTGGDVVSSITATSPIVASASTGAVTLSHAASGVTAGTYNNVTVNALGHVTGGSNVAYLTGYTEVDTLATVTGRGASTNTRVTLAGGITTNSTATRDKISVWSDTGNYVIGMGNGYTFGPIRNEFAMSFQMDTTVGRGFWWGSNGHSNAQGAMALGTDGYLTVARGIRLGGGTSDVVDPSLPFEVVGASGQLFSVTDSMTGTIFSANDVSGIPSIEVLDTGLVKIAQYSGNVVLGSGTDNGVNKLQVNGSVSATALTLSSRMNITNADIRSAATSAWTGDPGVEGKIQYHSNRWYIVADSSSNRIVQFRRDGSDVSHVDNSGNYVGNVTGNISGSSGSVTGLTLTSSANGINPDSVVQNQLGYNTSVSLFGQTDGGLYSSAFSSAWIHQIYGDFRTGQIATRGKNNGTWQAWRTQLDSGNFTSFTGGLSTTNTWTGQNYFQSNLGTTSGALSGPALQAFSTGTNSAFMSFHRSGSYAVNFGLDSDNVLRIGGWSAPANRWTLDMSGNMTAAGDVTSFSDERLKTNWNALPETFVESLAEVKSGTYTRIDTNERQAGSSAQDWQKLLPEVVAVSAGEEGTLALAYGNAALVSAVELAKRAVSQDAKIVSLENRIANLESMLNKLLEK